MGNIVFPVRRQCSPTVFNSCLIDDTNPSVISVFGVGEAWVALCKGVCIAAVIFLLAAKEEPAIAGISADKTEVFSFATQLLSVALAARWAVYKSINQKNLSLRT